MNQENAIVSARTRVFEERYSGGILDMNIFCFTIISEAEYNQERRSSSGGSNTISSGKNKPK
jgi:hypothetical protein